MSQAVIVGGQNYTVPDVGERSWGQNVTDLLIGISTALTGGGGSGGINAVTITTTPVNVTSGSTYLVDTTAARTFNLPTPAANAFFAIRDISGLASSNNITINRAAAELIDGVAANKLLATNLGYWIFVCDGTNWFTLLNYPVNLNQLNTAAGQVLSLPGGSVGAPPLSIGGATYGFANVGSGVIAVAAGNQVVRFDSTGMVLLNNVTSGGFAFTGVGRIELSDGTAGAPSLTFTSDTDTGLYRSGANLLELSTNGARRMQWDASGNIAIGASSSFGGGVGVIGIANATTVPTTNPTGGGVLYSESGILKWRDTAGTVYSISGSGSGWTLVSGGPVLTTNTDKVTIGHSTIYTGSKFAVTTRNDGSPPGNVARFEGKVTSPSAGESGLDIRVDTTGGHVSIVTMNSFTYAPNITIQSGDSDGTAGAMLFLSGAAALGNIGLNTNSEFGSGVGVIGIKNAGTNPSANPTGGGVLYCDAGALKYRGSSGTVTTLGPA